MNLITASSPLYAAAIVCTLALPCSGQCSIQEFTGSSVLVGDMFGRALELDGEHLIIGAYSDDTLAANAGAVYVFDLASGLAVEDSKLFASDGIANDYFGGAVAINGNIAIVGAAGSALSSTPGAAYVYRRMGGAWIEEQILVPSSSVVGDWFGTSIALDGNRAFIGAPHIGSNDAAVYVFEYSGGSWSEVQEIIPADLGNGDAFGSALALDGDRILISSPFDNQGLIVSAGSVYVYEESGGIWSETVKLTADIHVQGGFFGSSVDLDGNFAFVGAPHDSGFGAVFVFEETTPGSWDQLAELSSARSGAFGNEVNHEAGRLLVSAPNEVTPPAFPGGGAVHVFVGGGSTWIETDVMSRGGYDYGASIAQTTDFALIGKPGPSVVEGGSVFIEAFSGDDCNANGIFDLCDIFSGTSADVDGNGIPDECQCGVTNYCVANANTTGSAASITGTGTVSIAANDFGLTAGPVPNEPGIFFYAGAQLEVPFGEGFRCAGGTTYRLNPPIFATGNQLVRAIDLNALPSGPMSSLDTWNFQAWFRDPHGGPNGFNLSDAIEVTFCP